MRNFFILLVSAAMILPCFGQSPPQKTVKKNIPQEVPTKSGMQAQMTEAINELNKQIVELEKSLAEAIENKEDAETIKNYRDQIALLKKQVAMMGGLNKTMSAIPEKSFQQAGEEGKNSIPKRDLERINSIPKTILSLTEVLSLVKKIHTGVEKLIPPAEKTEANLIYGEVWTKYKTIREINNAASTCWIYGHWEKALWLSGKACIEDVNDADNLNNYASFLTMIGAEHVAIPILQYLNQKYPENSTILSNIGQAWFGLGDIASATGFLESATGLFPKHAMANFTLSRIYSAIPDTPRAIAAMRRSIQSTFTLDKAAELEALGGELDDDDIDFDYPMEEDAFGFEPFFHEFPPVPGSVGETPDAWGKWTGWKEAADLLAAKADADVAEGHIRTKSYMEKMTDPAYHKPVLEMHNGNVYYKAARKLPLAIKKKTALSIGEVMDMMANKFHEVTTERLNALEKSWRGKPSSGFDDCSEVDANNSQFMSAAKAIIDEGLDAMIVIHEQNKKKIDRHIQLQAYASLNSYNERSKKFYEEVWQRNPWILTYTQNFARAYGNLLKRPAMYSSCKDRRTDYPTQPKQLPVIKKPNCTYSDGIEFCIGAIKEICNTCSVDQSKIKVRKITITIGEITVSDYPGTTPGPQTEESANPSQIKTFSCDKTAYVKDNRRFISSGKSKCTVNSQGGSAPSSIRVMGGRILR